jgi:hypothetical protein
MEVENRKMYSAAVIVNKIRIFIKKSDELHLLAIHLHLITFHWKLNENKEGKSENAPHQFWIPNQFHLIKHEKRNRIR